jgi:hypothetical protein
VLLLSNKTLAGKLPVPPNSGSETASTPRFPIAQSCLPDTIEGTVLISISLPALSKAREAGRTVTCLSNLRQIMQASTA